MNAANENFVTISLTREDLNRLLKAADKADISTTRTDPVILEKYRFREDGYTQIIFAYTP